MTGSKDIDRKRQGMIHMAGQDSHIERQDRTRSVRQAGYVISLACHVMVRKHMTGQKRLGYACQDMADGSIYIKHGEAHLS